MTAPEDDDQRDRLLADVWRERFGTPGPDGELTWPRAAPPRRHTRRSNAVVVPDEYGTTVIHNEPGGEPS